MGIRYFSPADRTYVTLSDDTHEGPNRNGQENEGRGERNAERNGGDDDERDSHRGSRRSLVTSL